MSSSARFGDIVKMLNDCAESHELRLTTHFYMVKFNDRVFPTLPKYSDVEIGHVRKMVRHLKIDRECARQYVPL